MGVYITHQGSIREDIYHSPGVLENGGIYNSSEGVLTDQNGRYI